MIFVKLQQGIFVKLQASDICQVARKKYLSSYKDSICQCYLLCCMKVIFVECKKVIFIKLQERDLC